MTRDLYEEAPIAYVREDLDSRLISANRAALRILGLEPHEVPGILGKSLVPDTPDAQRRVREALASVGRGADTSGVVLELSTSRKRSSRSTTSRRSSAHPALARRARQVEPCRRTDATVLITGETGPARS